jgi:3-dehydroquinate dehydratase type I
MKICVPIQENSRKAAQKRLKELSEKADLAEIWLDQIQDIDIKTLLKDKPLPIVAVCKRPAEKGRFKGGFETLAEMLQKAIEAGADYVDLPLDMPEKLNKKIVQKARKKGCKVIISHHDFKKTPDYPELVKITEKMAKEGADVVKIATHANSLQDTVNIIALAKYLQGRKTPHILIAMGQKGRLSRILTPTLGGEMMFATLGNPPFLTR